MPISRSPDTPPSRSSPPNRLGWWMLMFSYPPRLPTPTSVDSWVQAILSSTEILRIRSMGP